MVSAVRERDAQRVIQFLRRRIKNLSQEALARMCGVAASTITRAEAGKGLTDRRRAYEALLGLGALSAGELQSAIPSQSAETLKKFPAANGEPTTGYQLREQLEVEAVDEDLVRLFKQQTQNLRLIDRKLGAHYLLAQSQAHVQQMYELLNHALPGAVRQRLALALAEAASLTGWQALDAGKLATSWRYYETAKVAARESDDSAVLAHVCAEQVYVLLDSGRCQEALAVIGAANGRAAMALPALLRSWLWAVEAEVRASLGEETGARRALEHSFALLPLEPEDPSLPFLMLDHTHLLRWRGHCLARLGDSAAIEDLTHSLERIIPLGLGRSEAGLRTDLALAYSARGDLIQSHQQAQRALEVSERSGSIRQRIRLEGLLGAGLQ